jgi:hypothetical protein
MKVIFDPNLRIAGISLVPWNRLGPEQWLPEYAIASLYGWDVQPEAGMPMVVSLSDEGAIPQLPKLNTHALLRTAAFQRLLSDKLAGYDLLVDTAFAQRYENKVTFRQEFSDTVSFPPFVIRERTELLASAAYFEQLMAGRAQIVIQDEQLSGGKGTFLVANITQYSAALAALATLSEHTRVVISDIVPNARERSIQCCITTNQIFTGPLQRQIIRNPLLANSAIVEGDTFCGAEIVVEDQQTPLHKQATALAMSIGEVMQRQGYRGIFGVDFLLDADNQLFVLEVNPRITGVTPLLTALYQGEAGIPFYLLHILEIGGYQYSIADATARFDKEGAILVLHSLSPQSVVIESMLPSGTYKINQGKLVMVSRNVHFNKLAAQECIIQQYMEPGMPIKPGGRMVTILFNRPVIDINTEKLYNDISETIGLVRQQIVTQIIPTP